MQDLQHHIDACTCEGTGSGQHLIQHNGGGKHISPSIHLSAMKLLGRHVARRADYSAAPIRNGTGDASNTEIGNS